MNPSDGDGDGPRSDPTSSRGAAPGGGTGGDEIGKPRNEREEAIADVEEEERKHDRDPIVEDSNPLTNEERLQRLEEENQRLRKRNREESEGREKAEAERKKAEAEREKAEAEREKEREERKKAEAEAAKAKLNLTRANGNYFASIEEVWGTATSPYNNSLYFEDIRRRDAPIFTSPDGVKYYEETLTKANESVTDFVQPESTRAYGSSRKSFPNSDIIWPVDIFGAPREKTMERAHLVPHSVDESTLYFDVAIWALGLQESEDEETKRMVPFDWDTVQKVVHGTADQDSRRVRHTGIKHSVPNMICLAHQAVYLDAYPCLLIIPILKLWEVKTWKGGRYAALVMAGAHKKVDQGGVLEFDASFSQICKGIGMTIEGNEASQAQIEIGRELLTCVLRGMAYSLAHRSPERDQHLTDRQKKMMDEYRKSFPANKNVLLVPSANPSPALDPWKVQFVKFRGATDPVDEATKKMHLAPDPLLLAVRAAINWSRRKGQQLLAAAEPQPDVFERDELYQLAMEEYLEKVDRALRPPDDDPEEFAKRLGQATTATAPATESE